MQATPTRHNTLPPARCWPHVGHRDGERGRQTQSTRHNTLPPLAAGPAWATGMESGVDRGGPRCPGAVCDHTSPRVGSCSR